MPGPIAKMGDLLTPMFMEPPTFFVPPTIPIVGIGGLFINAMPACRLEELEILVAALEFVYTAPPFITPGLGKFELIPGPENITERTFSEGPLVLIGAPIMAVFTVMVPAFEPSVPAPIPDFMLVKPGEFEIVPMPPVAVFGG